MIMVPGHAIFKGTGDGISDSDWILQPFQYGQGPTFIQHIESSLDLALQDSESLVIFSGGQSRKDAGMRSESQSYWELAKTRGLLDKFNKTSVFIEEFARDSFENLLFSVCRFYELAGSFPTKITVVGLDFKRSRFQNQHRKALMIPQDRFIYVGIDPPGINNVTRAGEISQAVLPFEERPYGCGSTFLEEKRRNRNPWRRRHGYEISCPQLRGLFACCGSGLYTGSLPWLLN